MRIPLTILAISLVACAVSATENSDLDEVVVTGARLLELRAAVIKAEDRMLTRYNELNQDHDLDIECAKLTPTGSRLSYRYCFTKLQKRLQQKDASEFMTFAHDADLQTGGAPPLAEGGVRLMERSADYRKNLRKLLEDNPDLRELVDQRAQALWLYEAAREKRLKGKVVVIE